MDFTNADTNADASAASSKRPKHDACDAHSEATDCGDCKKEPDDDILRCLATCVSTNEQCKRLRRSDLLTCTQHHKAGTYDPSTNNNYAINWASGDGHAEVVRLLLRDPRVDPAAADRSLPMGNTAIILASENGHVEVVRMLLGDPRVDPSTDRQLAIIWASANGHVEVVRLLLEWRGEKGKRVDPTAETNEAIRTASAEGHVDVVDLLLRDTRVNPAAEENQAILYASHNGHVQVVNHLLVWYARKKLPVPQGMSIDPSEFEALMTLGIAQHLSQMTKEQIDNGGWRQLVNYIKPRDIEIKTQLALTRKIDQDSSKEIKRFL